MITFIRIAALLALVATQYVHAEQKVTVGYGNTSFHWQEFKESINGSKIFLNNEDSAIPQLDLGYVYTTERQRVGISYATLSGGVDYSGLPISGAGNVGYTTTDYDMSQIAAAYGVLFNVAGIKPYIGLTYGYHQRERIINASSDFQDRLAEKYTYHLLGVLLEAEVFNREKFSIDLGAQYTTTSKGTNHLIDFDADIPIQSLRGFTYFVSANYAFIPSWAASFKILQSNAKMDKSAPVEIKVVTPDITYTQQSFQPESEQDITYIGLSISKIF